jgi:hypothetical protein
MLIPFRYIEANVGWLRVVYYSLAALESLNLILYLAQYFLECE